MILCRCYSEDVWLDGCSQYLTLPAETFVSCLWQSAVFSFNPDHNLSLTLQGIINTFILTVDHVITLMWKGSLVEMNPRLCSSPQLYEAFQCLLAHCFGFSGPQLLLLFWFTLTALISFVCSTKQPHATCSAPHGKQSWRLAGAQWEHLAATYSQIFPSGVGGDQTRS